MPQANKTKPGRGWWSHLCPATKGDLDQMEARLLAAIQLSDASLGEVSRDAQKLGQATDALDQAVKKAPP